MDIDKGVTGFLKLDKLEGFSFKGLMSDVFKHHDPVELEDAFAVGTTGHVPDILEVDTTWPRPWIFFRTFAVSLVAYILLAVTYAFGENILLLPGIIMTGTVAIPLAALAFFFEVNVTRNVPMKEIVKLFFIGGVASLIMSLVIYSLPLPGQGFLGDTIAGPVEETGKLIVILWFAGRIPRYRYKLNGLLFGAAVGTGFAVFESMGYAFSVLLSEDGGIGGMNLVIVFRGVLSPFGHIAWSAIVGHALWRVQDDGKFGGGFLSDRRFYPLFLTAIVLHMLWDAGHLRAIAIAAVAGWAVVIRLVQEGLREVRSIKIMHYYSLARQYMDNDGVIDSGEQAELNRFAEKYGIFKDMYSAPKN